MSVNVAHEKPKTFIYWLANIVVRSFFRLCYRIRVEGVENIPARGGIIIASNHLSNLDPPLLGIVIPRYIRFMGKAELFSVKPLGRLFTTLGGFPIHRGKVDRQAIRMAIEIVDTGGCLVMFPEGHRSKDGQLGDLMPGVASIAKKSRATVIPTAIVGKYRFWGKLTIRFGAPIFTGDLSSDESLRQIAQALHKLINT